MPAPYISSFGDDDHQEGETGLTIGGFDFGFFEGEVWMYENNDRTGNADQLSVTGWSDMSITGVDIPASPNNATGTVYLFVKRSGDLAWSLAYTFTLSAGGGATPPTVDAGGDYTGYREQLVQLDATVTPGTDASPTYLWSVQTGPNDPNGNEGSGTFEDATVVDAVFTPDTYGTYTLLLTVSTVDSSDVTDTATLVVTQKAGSRTQSRIQMIRKDDEEVLALLIALRRRNRGQGNPRLL